MRLTQGELERYKGRIVVNAYSQCPRFDYIETFATTVRMAFPHTVLAISGPETLNYIHWISLI